MSYENITESNVSCRTEEDQITKIRTKKNSQAIFSSQKKQTNKQNKTRSVSLFSYLAISQGYNTYGMKHVNIFYFVKNKMECVYVFYSICILS